MTDDKKPAPATEQTPPPAPPAPAEAAPAEPAQPQGGGGWRPDRSRSQIILFSGLILLGALAVGVAGVRLSALQWLALVATCLVGVLPFSALGLWLGTRVSGRGAPALINLIYLPMAFLSGLWVPLNMLPAVLQSIAPAWPAYHLAQIAQQVIGVDAGRPLLLHVAVLVAITVVFFLLARRRLVR